MRQTKNSRSINVFAKKLKEKYERHEVKMIKNRNYLRAKKEIWGSPREALTVLLAPEAFCLNRLKEETGK